VRPVQFVTGTAVPLERSDVDTDQIIPSEWLKRVDRHGFGAGLFAEWRDGPDFVLNRPEYAGATLLIAGPNFGTGSSREHAVWALLDYGFEAVISERFADIFKNNCTKQGLVPVEVTAETVHALIAALSAKPSLEITVDVEHGILSAPEAGIEASFQLAEHVRYRLLNGLDDIGITLAHEPDISAYEAARPAWMPVVRPG
jgi:3-isopropylmalate/(R)-2-methylmalate dehydratase small subunit